MNSRLWGWVRPAAATGLAAATSAALAACGTTAASHAGQAGARPRRLADGYGVQDQPWLLLVSSSGKIVWSHDGWLPLPALEAAVASRA